MAVNPDEPRHTASVDGQLQDRVAGLPAGKRLLFEQRVRNTRPGSAERSILRMGATSSPLDAQQRLWFLDQLEPGFSAYNITRALRVTGALELYVLSRACL